MCGLGFTRGSGHEQRLQRTRAVNRNRSAESMRGTMVVPDFVFVVVVPAKDAVIEELLRQLLLPPADSRRMREIDVRADPVPELTHARLAGQRVTHERALPGDVVVGRMIVEQARLDVGDEMDARLPELLHEGAWCGKLGSVPGEHVTPRSDAAVARTEMKRTDRNLVPGGLVDEAGEPRLRIGRVGQAHRRVGVAQAPARPERHAAGEIRELADDVANGRTHEQVIVEIAILDLAIAVEAVIVVVFAAEVEGRRGQRVVEEAVGDAAPRFVRNQVGPVLVQGIARLRVVPERVERECAQPPSVLVERAGLVAEAEVAIAPLARHEVAQHAVPGAPLIRLREAVSGESLSARSRPGEIERVQLHGDPQGGRLEHDMALAALEREARPRERGDVEAIATLPGNVDPVWRDHPCPWLAQASRTDEEHAREIIGEDKYPAFPAAIEYEACAVFGEPCERRGKQRLHRFPVRR